MDSGFRPDVSNRKDSPLNVLIVAPFYPTLNNGRPSYVTWLVDELKNTHNVCVLIPADSRQKTLARDRKRGVDIYRIWIPIPFTKNNPVKAALGWVWDFPSTMNHLRHFLRNKNIQIVHTTFHSYNYVFRFLRALGGPPYLVTLRGSETVFFEQIPGNHRTLAKWVVHGADQVATVSNALQQHAKQHFPKARNLITVYNGLSTENYPQMDKEDLQSNLPFTVPEPFCLLVGRLHPVKGFDLLIEAWPAILRDAPEMNLLIVGDGDCLAEYESRIKRLGLANRVFLAGALENTVVRALMKQAVLVVLPSRSEGLGMVCLEAGFAASTVVASRVGGLPEIVDDEETGLLFESENTEELARKCVLLILDEKRRRSMGMSLKQKIQERFSIATCASNYLEIYRSLIEHTEQV